MATIDNCLDKNLHCEVEIERTELEASEQVKFIYGMVRKEGGYYQNQAEES